MKTTCLSATLVMALLMVSGCGQRKSSGNAPDAVTAMPALSSDASFHSDAPVVGVDGGAGEVSGSWIVSTNEPFWQARVDGDVVLLTGAGTSERRLRIESRDTSVAGRVFRAADDQGKVEVAVTDAPCQDDMSGAAFPMTGTLAINGEEPHRGCARPADMAVPEPR